MSIPAKFGLSISVFQITSLDQQCEEMRVPARPITSGGSRTPARDVGMAPPDAILRTQEEATIACLRRYQVLL
jgi:hypothetical protein